MDACTKTNLGRLLMNACRNALRTFGLFSTSVDPSERPMVLAELVRSIFSIGNSGFVTGDQERMIVETPSVLSAFRSPSPPA